MTRRTHPRFATLYAILYIFTMGAVAINLFMLGLMGQAIGIAALSPTLSLLLSIPLSLPVNWLVTRWVIGLIQEADDG